MADPSGERAADEHLAATADVEQTGAERQADTQAGRDQRTGELQGLGQGADRGLEVVDAGVVDRAAEQRAVRPGDRLPRGGEEVAGAGEEVLRARADLLVGRQDQHRADQDGQEDRQHADGGVAGGDRAQHVVPGAVGAVVLVGTVRRLLDLRRRRALGLRRVLRVVGVAHETAPAGRSPVIIRPRTSRGVSAGTIPTIATAVEDHDPVGQRDHLVELGGDDEDGHAGVAGGHDLLVDELDRAHVDAAGRLGRDQQAQVAGELARHDDLLLVAARETLRPVS